ncbi:MAG TPA: hypothetical protein VNS09_20330 [Solirubrobacter sp.]|nr:hypothetical protein [Solirubrobacter sp.]
MTIAVAAAKRVSGTTATAWLVGAALGVAHWFGVMVLVLGKPLQRFDEGILFSTVHLTAAGQLPFRDFYLPYGWGLGLLGLPAEWWGPLGPCRYLVPLRRSGCPGERGSVGVVRPGLPARSVSSMSGGRFRHDGGNFEADVRRASGRRGCPRCS